MRAVVQHLYLASLHHHWKYTVVHGREVNVARIETYLFDVYVREHEIFAFESRIVIGNSFLI